MFQVLENGKPADYAHFKVSQSWDNSIHITWEEAVSYAIAWLGIYSPNSQDLKINTPYDYNGMGDTIEIRKLPE